MDASATGPRRLELPANLDLRAAAPLREQLLGLRGGEVELDGGQVERFGAPCLQVLISARRTFEADGTGLKLVNVSDRFAEALRIMGAAAILPAEGEETPQ